MDPKNDEQNKIDATNKGFQLLQAIGWRGGGLGIDEAGIVDPVS